jgi:hypothetical protein
MFIHTAYDGVLMAPYALYHVEVGSPSHTQHLYVGSAVTIMVGLLSVYVLSLPLMAPGVAEQDDTLEPDEERAARWPARRREGVNLADCVYASILCCLEDDFYEEEDARLATERARARRRAQAEELSATEVTPTNLDGVVPPAKEPEAEPNQNFVSC